MIFNLIIADICFSAGVINLVVGNTNKGVINLLLAVGYLGMFFLINYRRNKRDEQLAEYYIQQMKMAVRNSGVVKYDFDNLFNDLKRKENE